MHARDSSHNPELNEFCTPPVSSLQLAIARALNDSVIDHIQHEIISNRIQVRQKQSLSLRNSPPLRLQSPSLELSAILKRRKELMEQKAKFSHEELGRNYGSILQRNVCKEQEIKIIRETLEAQKSDERKLLQKQKAIESQVRCQQIQREERDLQRREAMKCQNRERALEKLSRLEEERQNRRQRTLQLNRHFQQVKKQRYLHENLDAEFKKLKEEQANRQKQRLNFKAKEQEFNFQEIRKHEAHYAAIMSEQEKEKKETLNFKLREMKAHESEYMNAHRPSVFFKTLFEENIFQEERKASIVAEQMHNQKKRQSFIEKIRAEHRQRIPKKQAGESSSKIPLNTGRSMSNKELKTKGNDYMREVHSSIDQQRINRDKLEARAKRKEFIQKQPLRKDYLREMRKQQNGEKVEKDNRKGVNLSHEMTELNAVLKKQPGQREKLFLAKLITQKIDDRVREGDVSSLITSIHAKLKVINQFSD